MSLCLITQTSLINPFFKKKKALVFTRLISSLIHIKKSTGHINNDSRMIIVRQVVLSFGYV